MAQSQGRTSRWKNEFTKRLTMSKKNEIPAGWFLLEEGSIIQTNDLYDANLVGKGGEHDWRPCDMLEGIRVGKTRYIIRQLEENNLVPKGWRQLIKGEVIITGDYFNARTEYPNQAYWMPYVKLVGHDYEGHGMRGIRCVDPTIPLSGDFCNPDEISIPRDFSTNKNSKSETVKIRTISFSPKDKVQNYLKRLKDPKTEALPQEAAPILVFES